MRSFTLELEVAAEEEGRKEKGRETFGKEAELSEQESRLFKKKNMLVSSSPEVFTCKSKFLPGGAGRCAD